MNQAAARRGTASTTLDQDQPSISDQGQGIATTRTLPDLIFEKAVTGFYSAW